MTRRISYKKPASFKLDGQSLDKLRNEGLPNKTLGELQALKDQLFSTEDEFLEAAKLKIEDHQTVRYKEQILKHARKPHMNSADALDTEWVPKFLHVWMDPDYIIRDGLLPLFDPICPLGKTAPLALLEGVADEIARRTGFSKTGVIAHILADLPLILPAWKFHVESWYGPRREWAEITLNTPDLSVHDLQRLLSRIRKYWRVAKTKRMTDNDYRLLDAVERAGGAPQTGDKGTVAFWKKIKNELELNVGWQAIQHKYKRLMEKLHPSPSEMQ